MGLLEKMTPEQIKNLKRIQKRNALLRKIHEKKESNSVLEEDKFVGKTENLPRNELGMLDRSRVAGRTIKQIRRISNSLNQRLRKDRIMGDELFRSKDIERKTQNDALRSIGLEGNKPNRQLLAQEMRQQKMLRIQQRKKLEEKQRQGERATIRELELKHRDQIDVYRDKSREAQNKVIQEIERARREMAAKKATELLRRRRIR